MDSHKLSPKKYTLNIPEARSRMTGAVFTDFQPISKISLSKKSISESINLVLTLAASQSFREEFFRAPLEGMAAKRLSVPVP